MRCLFTRELSGAAHRMRSVKSLCVACWWVLCAVTTSVMADGLNLGGQISMGSWSPHAQRYLSRRPVCAWSSTPDGIYRVIAGSPGNAGSFQLLSDLGERVRFEVRWRDNDSSGVWERLIPGLPSSGRYRYASTANCSDSDTQIQVRLSKGDADRAPGGFYSSVLTITLVTE